MYIEWKKIREYPNLGFFFFSLGLLSIRMEALVNIVPGLRINTPNILVSVSIVKKIYRCLQQFEDPLSCNFAAYLA